MQRANQQIKTKPTDRAYLDQAHVSVTKLLVEDLVVLLTHRLGGLLIALKVNKGLHKSSTAAAGWVEWAEDKCCHNY